MCISTQYLFFSLWCASLYMMISRSIHISSNGTISFLFMVGWYSIVFEYHIFFIHHLLMNSSKVSLKRQCIYGFHWGLLKTEVPVTLPQILTWWIWGGDQGFVFSQPPPGEVWCVPSPHKTLLGFRQQTQHLAYWGPIRALVWSPQTAKKWLSLVSSFS